jgi:hypothetical protein
MPELKQKHAIPLLEPRALVAYSLLLVFATAAVGFLVLQRHRSSTEVRWKAVDGRWTDSNGIISVLTYGRGDMQVGGDERWTDYRFSADVRYDLFFPETHYGDAGLGVRISDASEGVDSYRGYYAGIRADGQTLFFGRADYGWHELAETRMANPVHLGEWYHMQIELRACNFRVEVVDPSKQTTVIAYTERNCKTSGAVSLRSFYAQSSWQNVTVTSLR